MPRMNSTDKLEELRKTILSKRDPNKPCIAVCSGAACQGLDNDRIIRAFEEEIVTQSLDNKLDIRATGCHGFCQKGPNVI
ncbi:MAG: (2Fe-2S) ferredoxin domain-containing protein, partial [Deltaproteobacteria bacterium]|nr:(2Fe-2S) ferredoxin domain-containing protein [Deltaproteobacteria bacterium]